MTVAPAKGSVEQGSAMTNLFRLEIDGLPDTLWTSMGGLERKITMTQMPDGTWQSTGFVPGIQIEATQLCHHEVERLALQLALKQTEVGDPLSLRAGMLTLIGNDGAVVWTVGLVFKVSGLMTPDLELGDGGEPVELTWELSIDDWEPV